MRINYSEFLVPIFALFCRTAVAQAAAFGRPMCETFEKFVGHSKRFCFSKRCTNPCGVATFRRIHRLFKPPQKPKMAEEKSRRMQEGRSPPVTSSAHDENRIHSARNWKPLHKMKLELKLESTAQETGNHCTR